MGPVHVNLVFIACAQKPHLNAYADVSNGVRCLMFGVSLHDSSELSLLADAISAKISCTCLYLLEDFVTHTETKSFIAQTINVIAYICTIV